MDSMTEWEIELCIKNMHFASKNEWEQARMIMYTNLSPYFKRGQTQDPKSLFPLSTDEDYQPDKHTDITKEEIERLEEQAAYLENLFAQTEKQDNT